MKEKEHGKLLAQYLRLNDYVFTHIANEGYRNMAYAMELKRCGLNAGLPDYLIILKRGSLLFIELKQEIKIGKRGKPLAKPPTSPEQLFFIDRLNSVKNVQAVVCYGYEHAKNVIIGYENLR